ncbi:hypothetical protein [Rhizomicrobium electricum]|uniref:Uncharacterized protein n=1 Tax=Rhizomicrobium electricum TaxID=480070 RepID=A0ABN1EMA5_9PROT|nr:hypothetical protein [Rhizomicrobium electricum]NIJ47099.1 hypothetical protein [Rhizomicrobium electricum]
MRTAARLLASGLALAAVQCLSPATAGHMSDFDLNKLDSWADAIAVCDVTRFLLTDPDTGADAIIVAGRGNTHVALYKPLYQPPTNFFSDVMRQTFERVQKAGQVSFDGYSRARIHYAGRMISAYSGATLAEKHYMADQMELCYHLAVRAGVKLTPAMRQEP